MTRPTVFLFDLDGTLLLTGGAGRRAFEDAFAAVTGRGDACAGFSFAGMTDRAIARAGLGALNEPATESRIDALISAYLARLAAEVNESAGYRVMPHVRETLGILRGHAAFAVGLGTGNVRLGAEIKLQRGDLWRCFDFGGFGCDHEDRTEMLRIGAARGAAKLGVSESQCRTVVIGDTVRDVAAAQGIGAECIAVGTGGVALDELIHAGATAAFADLAALGALDALLGEK